MKKLLIALCIASTMVSCKKDPVIPNEEEVITTLRYILIPSSGDTTIMLEFQDLDGDGGDAPVITSATLKANETYTGVLDLLNELETPAESITAEILEEDDEHQFFFESNISDLSISYTDEDEDGNPLGVNTSLTTGNAGNGTLSIVLRHEPNKDAENVANGDISNAGGETDIEVIFNIDVE